MTTDSQFQDKLEESSLATSQETAQPKVYVSVRIRADSDLLIPSWNTPSIGRWTRAEQRALKRSVIPSAR